jgi:V/A-type H+-transporting ATPase subunit A
MKLVIDYYDESNEALNNGAKINDIVALPVRESIGRFKYVPEEKVNEEFKKISDELSYQIKVAQTNKEEY